MSDDFTHQLPLDPETIALTTGAAPVSPWNIANIITMIRIAMIPVFVGLLLGAGWNPVENVAMRWWACAIFVIAAFTDKLDGYLARSRGLVTDLGKLLDPIADKALTGAAFVLLAFPLLEIPWFIPVVILIRELGITLMRMVLRKYTVLPAGRGGKLKTVFQATALALLLMPLGHLPHWVTIVAWTFLAIALVLTVLTGIDYALDGWALRRRRPAAL